MAVAEPAACDCEKPSFPKHHFALVLSDSDWASRYAAAVRTQSGVEAGDNRAGDNRAGDIRAGDNRAGDIAEVA